MHPETARRALESFPAARILDPFVGSGTVAVEAVRIGRPFTGVDVSKVALEVAWARTRVWVPDACRTVEREAGRVASDAAKAAHRDLSLPGWAENVRAWFTPHTLKEIVLLGDRIAAVEGRDLRRILQTVLSSIVVKVSRQAFDSAGVADRDFRPWRPGTAFQFFRERGVELTGMLLRVSSDLHKRKVAFVEPELRLADSREVDLKSPFDLVLTSPPYPGVYDYARQHRLRFPLFDDDGTFADRHEMGSRRAPGNYEADLTKVLKRIPLGANGRMILLIGDGRIGGTILKTDEMLERIKGFKVEALATQGRVGGLREHLALLARG
jgi:16S rRNA G966 N2-methylase RsmD